MSKSTPRGIRETRPGVWEVRVSQGYRRDGRRRTVSRTVHGTEDDALAARAGLEAEMGRSPTLGDPMTLDEYFWGRFLPGRRRTTTRANAETCESIYRCHIAEKLGSHDLASIDYPMVREWVSRLPPQSATTYVRVLRTVLNQARMDGLIESSPMGDGYRFRMPKGRRTAPLPVWGPDELTRCMATLAGDRIYPLWLVMVGAGLSRSEALALDWDGVSWREGDGHHLATVTVAGAFTARDGMKDPKNDRRYRRVPVAEPFSDELWACRRESGPLCVGKMGSRMSANYISKYWKRLFEPGHALDGMPFVGLNRMRATYSTMMQAAGVSDTVINAMQGRSHGSEVLYSNYLNPYAETFERSARAMGRMVDGC